MLHYDLATGTLLGWMGRVNSPPTACAESALPSSGDFTHSWCTGGSAAIWTVEDSSLGVFSYVGGLSATGGALFMAEVGANRIQRFDAATGIAAAWLGTVATPVAGWTVQDVPGPAAGNGDGLFQSPTGIALDGEGDALYVVSTGRLSKFRASTGEFLGWTGRTTSRVASCDGPMPTTIPGPTHAFCKGGTSEPGIDDGELGATMSVAVDSGYIFVADARISRFDAHGRFAGWIGTIASKVGIAPSTCASAAVGDFSPTGVSGASPTGFPVGTSTGQLTSPSRATP